MFRKLLSRCKLFFYYQLAIYPREFRGGMVLLCLILFTGMIRIYVHSVGKKPREFMAQEIKDRSLKVVDSDTAVTSMVRFTPASSYGRCPEPMDLNMADTVLLRRLHGIGKVLSGRIIRYRELLGGYIVPSQVGEVYGLSDSTLRHILPRIYVDETFIPVKINLEKASYMEMYDHPYISSKEATSIMRYREQHNGRVRLDLILSLKSERRKKILPYVVESTDSD